MEKIKIYFKEILGIWLSCILFVISSYLAINSYFSYKVNQRKIALLKEQRINLNRASEILLFLKKQGLQFNDLRKPKEIKIKGVIFLEPFEVFLDNLSNLYHKNFFFLENFKLLTCLNSSNNLQEIDRNRCFPSLSFTGKLITFFDQNDKKL